MNYKVFIASRAQQQLAECARWWAEHRDAEQAARWLEGIEEAISGLCENAQRYPPARENGLYDLPYTVRQMHYGLGNKPTHRAVFEIRGDTVYVLAIRHVAQDDLSPAEL